MNDRAAWLEARRLGIGGSDCAAALGLSKWTSPLALYADKIGEGEAKEETDAMRFGTLLEPIVRAEAQRRLGATIVYGQPAIVSPVYPWMRVNLDGRISDTVIFEAKTARSDAGWGDPGSDDIPQEYVLQNQHAMIVTGAVVVEIAVLIAGSDFRLYRQQHNPSLAELIIEGERAFWRCVQTRTPPDPTTLQEINLRWRQAESRSVQLSPEGAAAVRRLTEIREQIKTLEAEGDQCEMMIKSELREADVATADGVVAVTWKQSKPSRAVDWKRIEAEHPALVAQYAAEKPGSRRFLIK
jgi:putative phage-type endonuclease